MIRPLMDYRSTNQKRVLAYESQVRLAAEKQALATLDVGHGGSRSIASIHRQGQVDELYGLVRDWVWTVSSFIAKKVSSQSWFAGEIEGAEPNRERFSRPLEKRYLPSSVKAPFESQNVEILPHHEVLDALQSCNGIQGKTEFLWMSALNLLITGEAYWIAGVVQDEGSSKLVTWAHPTRWIRPVHEPTPFSSYELNWGGTDWQPLESANVARTYIPDPSNPFAALSPMQPILRAIRTDLNIQRSQDESFQRGIHPNVILTVAKDVKPDGTQGGRPVLHGHQRRQLIRSVRDVWDATVNQGDPAIIDGLLEDIKMLDRPPREMDWENSGKIVKKRIIQGYHVSELAMGEIEGGNRAQAVMAQQMAADNAVNPVCDAFSCTATEFFGPMFEQPQRLVVGLTPWEPSDPDLDLKRWDVARKNNDVSANEFRSEVLRIPPRDDDEETALVLNQQGAGQVIAQLMQQVATGAMSRDSMAASLVAIFRMSEEEARAIAGEDEEDEPVVQPEMPPFAASFEKSVHRDICKAWHVKTVTQQERLFQTELSMLFQELIRDTSRKVLETDETDLTGVPSSDASHIVGNAFNEAEFTEKLKATSRLRLARVMWEGSISVLKPSKATAVDLVSGVLTLDISSLPTWFLTASTRFLDAVFAQPYWREIAQTVRKDVQSTVLEGLEEGLSIRDVAKLIVAKRGRDYTMQRAKMVADTEINGAANAGHMAGMEQIATETGLNLGKEWSAIGDDRTRPAHSEADGQVVAADADFTVGGEQAPYPGHYSLSAKNRIRCRCTILTATPEEF